MRTLLMPPTKRWMWISPRWISPQTSGRSLKRSTQIPHSDSRTNSTNTPLSFFFPSQLRQEHARTNTHQLHFGAQATLHGWASRRTGKIQGRVNPHCLLYPNSELIIHFLCQHRPMRGCPIINCCGTVPGNLFTQSESPFPPLSIINFCSDTYLLGRLTNFVGILSQGLRIAPPEAPVTGYMFGKGCKRSSFPPPPINQPHFPNT